MRKALVIGLNNYPSSPLSGCINDAKNINELLEENGDGSPNFSTKLVTDQYNMVTKAILRESIENLFNGDNEVALLYYSGHGFISSTGGVIVTPDYKKYDEGISMTDILDLANKSKARDRIIILDCCHSGTFGTINFSRDCASLLSDGLTVLTASKASEKALETHDSGIFTALLVDALKGEAADVRGYVTPGNIYSYVDAALSPWDQRPIFKTNVSRFTPIRKVNPQIQLEKLRKLAEYFENPDKKFKLDPSYEDTDTNADKDNVAIFKDLQKFESVGLVRPVGEEHMYFAAIHNKSCMLTALGRQYWRLANEKRI